MRSNTTANTGQAMPYAEQVADREAAVLPAGDDVAQAVIDVVKKEVKDTINFGCGEAVTIKETIETIVDSYKEITGKTKKIVWDETKPNGDLLRCLGSDKQRKYGILPTTSLKMGIKQTLEEYLLRSK